jgi:hypothetical protein
MIDLDERADYWSKVKTFWYGAAEEANSCGLRQAFELCVEREKEAEATLAAIERMKADATQKQERT